ncbi:hypothetical protein P0Y35_07190 [Kiritimatiellaeota bacterium B1221]|nr:hypothetical protein [Kiritimatiellaeota bacterium B1221]
MNKWRLLCLGFLHGGSWAIAGGEVGTGIPSPVAQIEESALREASGLTKSSFGPWFWSLNDSGNDSVLFSISALGKTHGVVKVAGVKNVDWEAVATDGEGGLWIGDFGNNRNRRKDLQIHRVGEPGDNISVLPLRVNKTIRFRFPDQLAFPPEKWNFDCEAMFIWEKKVYLLTKHRADTDTKLYRIEDLETEEIQDAVLLDRFEGIGQVTDAALTADGGRLAVLTFSGIWIFDRPKGSDRFLRGSGRHFLFKNWALRQIEGIAWIDEGRLLICNEQKDIFQLPVEGEGWVAFTGTGAESADELR